MWLCSVQEDVRASCWTSPLGRLLKRAPDSWGPGEVLFCPFPPGTHKATCCRKHAPRTGLQRVCTGLREDAQSQRLCPRAFLGMGEQQHNREKKKETPLLLKQFILLDFSSSVQTWLFLSDIEDNFNPGIISIDWLPASNVYVYHHKMIKNSTFPFYNVSFLGKPRVECPHGESEEIMLSAFAPNCKHSAPRMPSIAAEMNRGERRHPKVQPRSDVTHRKRRHLWIFRETSF